MLALRENCQGLLIPGSVSIRIVDQLRQGVSESAIAKAITVIVVRRLVRQNSHGGMCPVPALLRRPSHPQHRVMAQ